MITKNKVILVIVLILSMNTLFLYAQNVEGFFEDTDFTAQRIKDAKVMIGGELLRFRFGSIEYTNIKRKLNTDGYFENVKDSDIISSNSLSALINIENYGEFYIKGAEIYLNTPRKLSELGFELHSTRGDLESSYFIVAHLTEETDEQMRIPTWRMIAYFDEDLVLRAEIVGVDGLYFATGAYEYLSTSTGKIEKLRLPGMFVLERIDQSVISVINVYGKKVLWYDNFITQSDELAIAFYAGIFNIMRFDVSKNDRLYAEKKYIEKLKRKKQKEDFLINQEDIRSPESIW